MQLSRELLNVLPKNPDNTRKNEYEKQNYSMAIVPEFRGHGLWRLLFDDAIETAKEKGFHRVTLICEESYPKLAHLYTSYGFVPENTIMFFDTLCRKMSLSI